MEERIGKRRLPRAGSGLPVWTGYYLRRMTGRRGVVLAGGSERLGKDGAEGEVLMCRVATGDDRTLSSISKRYASLIFESGVR